MDSTLAKGLAVLEWLTRAQRPCRVSEVAQAFGLAPSNAHRTLQTLVECGWVEQDSPSSAYRASLKLFELGALAGAVGSMTAQLRPLLARLARESGETIHLTSLEGAEILYLDKFDSPLPVAAYSRIGGRAPAYCVASGKALLAARALDANALHALLGELQPHTPKTITGPTALQAELARTRTRGYAENREEWRTGVCGLGVAIDHAQGAATLALGMSVPSIRFTRVQARHLAALLQAGAQEASRLLQTQGQGATTAAAPRLSAPALSPKPPQKRRQA